MSPEALAAGYEQTLLAGITDAEVRQYYDRHPDLFRTGGRVRASHILVASRADADAVLAELKAGKPFATVARARSADATTAPAGGDLGWVSRGVMVKPFEDALFALAPGGIGTVQTGRGLHVLTADAVDPGTLLPYDAVRELARAGLAAERIAQERARLADRYGARTWPQLLVEGAR